MAAAPSSSAIETPAMVERIAAGRPVRLVWRNELGGLTFEVTSAGERCFVKWAPVASQIDLRREVARLTWAAPYTAVPQVLDHGADGSGAWIVTAALPGESAVAERWKADPATAVAAIGRGLRTLHDTLPVETCPFSWSVEGRLESARSRAVAGCIDPRRWHVVHRTLTLSQALEIVSVVPSTDRLVVCHGDTCAPNTLIADDGGWAGHVDLGALGVADRWADLAIATWSTTWNYGPGWEDPLLEAYGIGPDLVRTRYYRLLWDLGP